MRPSALLERLLRPPATHALVVGRVGTALASSGGVQAGLPPPRRAPRAACGTKSKKGRKGGCSQLARSAPGPRAPSQVGALEPAACRWAGCARVPPLVPCAARGLRPKKTKTQKRVLRSQYIFEPAKHRRAPAPGHARPRGGARWNRPRVVGQGASGSPPSFRAPPRVACGPKIKKGSERVRAVQMLTKSVLHIPGRARRRGVGFNRIFPLVSCTTRSLGTETPERG